MKARKVSNWLAFLGLFVLVATFIFCWILFPIILEWKIKEQTQLRNGSETFEKWRNITMPIFIQFNFFNITNPKEVMSGERPIFHEVGPFVYSETRLKDISEINDEDDTVTYRQAITYYFVPEESFQNSEDVQLTVLNIPLASVAKQIIDSGESIKGMVLRDNANEFIRDNAEPVFLKRTVREMLFGGYKVPLFQELSKLAGEELIPNNTFGLYYPKNGTFGEEFTVSSGITNDLDFGKVQKWNKKSELSWWNNDQCNEIVGTDGSLFSALLNDRNRTLRIFSEEFCRSIFMNYEKDVDYEGIPAYRFKMSPSIWESGLSNPENKCFCTNGGAITKEEDIENACKRNGVMSLAGCKKGAPVYASPPFFLYGDEEDQNILGVKPNVEEHDTYLDLEPNSGMVVRASKKFQVNVKLHQYKRLIGFRRVPEMLFPVLWGEERVAIPEDRVEYMKKKLLLPITVIEMGKWYFIIGSFLIVIIALTLRFMKSKRSPKSYNLNS